MCTAPRPSWSWVLRSVSECVWSLQRRFPEGYRPLQPTRSPPPRLRVLADPQRSARSRRSLEAAFAVRLTCMSRLADSSPSSDVRLSRPGRRSPLFLQRLPTSSPHFASRPKALPLARRGTFSRTSRTVESTVVLVRPKAHAQRLTRVWCPDACSSYRSRVALSRARARLERRALVRPGVSLPWRASRHPSVWTPRPLPCSPPSDVTSFEGLGKLDRVRLATVRTAPLARLSFRTSNHHGNGSWQRSRSSSTNLSNPRFCFQDGHPVSRHTQRHVSRMT
jgi:hypothetical protein